MSKWFNINYLRAPEMGKAAGTGAAFGAIGDSLMKLGAIGAAREKIDTENKRRAEDVAFRDSELAFRKDVHKDDMDFKNKDFIFRQGAHRDDMNARTNQLNWEQQKFKDQLNSENANFSKELLVKQQNANNTKSYYDYLKNEAEAKRKAQEVEDKANVAIYREMFPEQSKNKSDIEILALGKIMQNFKNNKKEGHDELIKVPWEFHKEYGHLNVTKITKDGVYALKSFVDELAKEADARSEAKGEQTGYKDRMNDLKRSKPLIFGDDGAM